ncbi:flagellar FliL protein [Arboricoccus pini]|uniref:Flagellar protein FliL n=1 Tax=Arboricoccus pini TaxID=1963835 RepID=A0A212RSD1_9PROT|nr:flagellar basal body-associated FliL family protein [Arboricoccus pini]SNB75512.1 flagellar FliL protein [Arboricoccus pini]
MSTAIDAVPNAAPRGRNKGVLILIAVLLLLFAAAGASAWYLGIIGGGRNGATRGAEAPAAEARLEPAMESKVAFVDMPDMLVNLTSSDRRLHFLKTRFALEFGNEQDGERIKDATPRILDAVQLYLRALSVDEVGGSEGMQRLKDELKARINLIIAPAQIQDVLFKELLVQ